MRINLAALTERLGQPASEQATVLAWVGAHLGQTWTEEEARELASAWAAEEKRIDEDWA